MVRTSLIVTLVVSLASCGGESSSSPAKTGGSTGSGGSAGTGETGGSATSGGGTATGGNPATGGTGFGGNTTPGGTGGFPATCGNGVERNSDDERAIILTTEASSLAPSPQWMVAIGISLVDPDFEFERLQTATGAEREAIIAEREAQLAPTQDPIEELLSASGAEEISRSWLVNWMFARLPARHVVEVPCWPAVVRIELSDNYWDVADPPWDPSTVGDDACPLEGDACPPHCRELWSSCIDATTGCLTEPVLAACSQIENGIPGAFQNCAARSDTGALCTFDVPVSEPGYVGWATCTAEQEELAFSALPCGTRAP